MLKLPQRANTNTNIANRTQPNQNFERNFHNFKNLNPFSKNPQFLNPNLSFYIISEKHEENVLENIP